MSDMAQKHKRIITCTAWISMLLVSTLPDILLREFFGLTFSWMVWAKLAVLVVLGLAGFLWQPLKSLQRFFRILSVLFLAEWGSGWLAATGIWQSWFGGSTAGFTRSMLSTQLLRLGVALVMLCLLLLLFKKRAKFFFVRGDLQATAQPIPLIMTKPDSWKKLGWILAVCITGGTLLFLFLGGLPSSVPFTSILALFPFVILFAAINAFAEELNYRAGLLAVLEEPLGGKHALLITALFFGIGHFYGVPYGITGVIMASLLGWLLGKSMLETRGFCWAWFIHFLQDVAIFTFMGIGSIIPGG